MKLIERYEELVERPSTEVPLGWKLSVIIACLLSSISSFVCAIAFHNFWYEVSGEHCLFWADVELDPKITTYAKTAAYVLSSKLHGDKDNDDKLSSNWLKEMFAISNVNSWHCRTFILVCLISFTLALMMIVLFAVCGRGGYQETSLFSTPWRIVLPSCLVSIAMTITTMSTTHGFTDGYLNFTENLHRLAHQVLKAAGDPFRFKRACEAFRAFATIYNIHDHDTCSFYSIIQFTSWLMTWGWIVNLFILTLRILTAADFILYRINVFEIPRNESERNEIIERVNRANLNAMGKEKESKKTNDDDDNLKIVKVI